jgi:superfamily II DNA or RNA helicase
MVDVVLTNRYARFPRAYPHDALDPFFRYRPHNYNWMTSFREGRWDGWVRLLRHRRVGCGLFLAQQSDIEKEIGSPFHVIDNREVLSFQSVDTNGARPYQVECLKAMQETPSGGIVLGATGSGKTRLAGMYFQSVQGTGVFIVDELTLMKQAQKEIADVMSEAVGMVGNQEFDPQRITVATIQTLHKHTERAREEFARTGRRNEFALWVDHIDVMIIDELHIQLNRRNFETVRMIQPKVIFGLTATLELQKERVRLPAMDVCGPVLYEYPLERGVDEGYLTPGVVMSVAVHQPDTELDKYTDAYNRMIVNSPERNQVVIDLVKEAYRRGRSTIVLVERVAHVEGLSEALEEIPHRVVYGAKTVEDRLVAKQDFDAKEIRLIIANKVFKKGVDIKSVDTIIEVSALKSKNDVVQKYGRGIRLAEGKRGLLYFDIGDRSVVWGTKNRFYAATVSRLKALQLRGIPVQKYEPHGEVDPEVVFNLAERFLNEVVRNREIRKNGKN